MNIVVFTIFTSKEIHKLLHMQAHFLKLIFRINLTKVTIFSFA